MHAPRDLGSRSHPDRARWRPPRRAAGLARYGPETKEARSLLQRSAAATIDRFWPAEGVKRLTIDPAASPVEALYDKIEALSPQSDAQRSL